MHGSTQVKIWKLADVVAGGRSHHSLLVWKITKVSLRSGMYFDFGGRIAAGIMK